VAFNEGEGYLTILRKAGWFFCGRCLQPVLSAYTARALGAGPVSDKCSDKYFAPEVDNFGQLCRIIFVYISNLNLITNNARF
jgi:hypothetical protein